MPAHNVNKLSLIYDKKQKDFIVKYPRKCDGKLALHHMLNNILMHRMAKDYDGHYNFDKFNFKEELEKRGYDLKTLKFSIELKKEKIT